MLSVFDHASIRKRHFSMPIEWFEEEHSFGERNDIYIECASSLGMEAMQNCLAKTSTSFEQVDHLILSSSTGLATPSLDAHLLNRLPFREDVKRTPIWGLGCVGGAVGLSRALEYASIHPQECVLLLCVELCGLAFQKDNLTKSNFIATALFGDGAAAVLVAGNGVRSRDIHPQWIASSSTTWKDSLDVMGWKVGEKGLDVVFSRDIPSLIRDRLRQRVDQFLHKQGLSLADIVHFVFHPGGVKVLQAYADALQIPMERMTCSACVLEACGNMSSPTVLFVLEEVLERAAGTKAEPRPGDYGLLCALGPGFSLELVLLQWQEALP